MAKKSIRESVAQQQLQKELLDEIVSFFSAVKDGAAQQTPDGLEMKWWRKAEALGPEGFLTFLHDRSGYAPMCKAMIDFGFFRPAAKVRFNVFPETEEMLRVIETKGWAATRKAAVDGALQMLWRQIPTDYRNERETVTALLSADLPSGDEVHPVSLVMDPLGFAVLKDLSRALGASQGAVLAAAVSRFFSSFEAQKAELAKRGPEAAEILDNLEQGVLRLKALFPEDRSGLGVLAWVLEEVTDCIREREKREAVGTELRSLFSHDIQEEDRLGIGQAFIDLVRVTVD